MNAENSAIAYIVFFCSIVCVIVGVVIGMSIPPSAEQVLCEDKGGILISDGRCIDPDREITINTKSR